MLALIAAAGLLAGGERFFAGSEVDFWRARRPAAPAPAGDLWPDSAAPAPVRRLLDDPTPENARAYVAWQKERLRRLRSALAALAAAEPGLLYFAREGCRACLLQDRELEGLPVTRVPEGSPLWELHGVTATPTLVVRGKVFRGFTPRTALLAELRRD